MTSRPCWSERRPASAPVRMPAAQEGGTGEEAWKQTVASVHSDIGYAPAQAMLSAYGFYDGKTRRDAGARGGAGPGQQPGACSVPPCTASMFRCKGLGTPETWRILEELHAWSGHPHPAPCAAFCRGPGRPLLSALLRGRVPCNRQLARRRRRQRAGRRVGAAGVLHVRCGLHRGGAGRADGRAARAARGCAVRLWPLHEPRARHGPGAPPAHWHADATRGTTVGN